MIELPKKYDKELFKAWQGVSLDFVRSLETGLSRFNMRMPFEAWQSLLEAIQEAKKLLENPHAIDDEKARRAILRQLKNVHKKIHSLSSSDSFENNRLKAYLFHAETAFFDLLWHAKISNILVGVGQGVLSPSGKKAKTKPSKAERFLTSAVAKKTPKIQLKNLKKYQHGLEAYPVEPISVNVGHVDVPNTSPLEQILGPAYASTQSQQKIESIADAKQYMREQIYGGVYEYYFTQVATVMDLYFKCEDLAAGNNPEEQKQKLHERLKESGFGALAQENGCALFDELALHLGFKSARDLSITFNQMIGGRVDKYKAAKMAFMANAQEDSIEDDKIIQINKLIGKGYKASRTNMKNKDYSKNNWGYHSLLTGMGHSHVWQLNVNQLGTSILSHFVHDDAFADMKEDNPLIYNVLYYMGQAANSAMNRFETPKRIVDKFIVSNLSVNALTHFNLMYDLTGPIRHQWGEQRSLRMEADEKRFEALLKHSEEELRQIVISRKLDLLRAEIEFNAIPEDQKNERSVKESVLNDLEDELERAHIALNQTIQNTIINMDYQDLKKKTEQLNQKIKQAKTQRKTIVNQLEAKQSDKPKGFGGFFVRLFDGLAKVFGLKTKHMKRMEKNKLDIKTYQRAINEIDLDVGMAQAQLKEVKAQVKYFKLLKDESLVTLKNRLFNDLSSLKRLEDKIHAQYDQTILDQKQDRMDFEALNWQITANTTEIMSRFDHKTLDLKKLLEKLDAMKEISNYFRDFQDQSDRNKTQEDTTTLTDRLRSLSHFAKRQVDILEQQYHDTLYHQAFTECQQYIKANAIDKLIDPSTFFQAKPEFNALNEASKHQLMVEFANALQQKIIDTDLTQLSFDLLNQMALQSRLVYHAEVLNTPNQVKGHDKQVALIYEDIIGSIEAALLKKYDPFMNTNFIQMGEHIPLFTRRIAQAVAGLREAQKNHAAVENHYNSYVFNPFELFVSKEMLRQAKVNMQAHEDEVSALMPRLSMVLDHYVTNLKQYAPGCEYRDLNLIIDQSNKVAQEVLEFLKDDEITSFLVEKLTHGIDSIAKARSDHLFHHGVEMKEGMRRLSQQNTQIEAFEHDIQQGIRLDNSFSPKQKSAFTDRLTSYHSNIMLFGKQLQQMAEKIKTRKVAQVLMGSTDNHWDDLYDKFQNIHEKAQKEHKEGQQVLNVITLYEAIVQGEPLNQFNQRLDQDQSLNALILSINYENFEAFKQIYKSIDTMPSPIYGQCLQLAADTSQPEVVLAMIHDNKGALIDSQSFIRLLETMPSENEDKEMYSQIFYTLSLSQNYAMSQNQTERFCQQANRIVPTRLSSQVQKNLFIDHDYPALMGLQSVYQLHISLLTTLAEQIESKIQALSALESSASLQQVQLMKLRQDFDQKLARIESLSTHMKSHYNNSFENQQRKETYEHVWEQDVQLIQHKTQTLRSSINDSLEDEIHPQPQKILEQRDAQETTKLVLWGELEKALHKDERLTFAQVLQKAEALPYYQDLLNMSLNSAIMHGKMDCFEILMQKEIPDLQILPLFNAMLDKTTVNQTECMMAAQLILKNFVEPNHYLTPILEKMGSKISSTLPSVKPYRRLDFFGSFDGDKPKIEAIRAGFAFYDHVLSGLSSKALSLQGQVFATEDKEQHKSLQNEMSNLLNTINYFENIFMPAYLEIHKKSVTDQNRLNTYVEQWQRHSKDKHLTIIHQLARDIDEALEPKPVVSLKK